MEPGKHAYVHYPLYTSCAGEYNVYKIRGARSSVGYDVDFEINAIGAPEMLFISDHPDGDPEKEFQAQRDAEFQRKNCAKAIISGRRFRSRLRN